MKIQTARTFSASDAKRTSPAYGWQCCICGEYSRRAGLEVRHVRRLDDGTTMRVIARYDLRCIDQLANASYDAR